MVRATLILMFAFSFGCAAAPPESPDEEAVDMAKKKPKNPDMAMGGPPDVRVDTPPASSQYDTVMITGAGPAGGTVIIDTPAPEGTVPCGIPDDGHFCVDVPLAKNTNNSLKVRVQDNSQQESKSVSFSVMQAPGQMNTSTSTNLALNQSMDSAWGLSFDSGKTGDLNDGTDSNFVKMSTWWWYQYDTYVWIKLAQPTAVDRIRVVSDPTCPLAAYQVLLSEDASHGAPVGELGGVETGWTVEGEKVKSSGAMPGTPAQGVAPTREARTDVLGENFQLPAAKTAAHVGIIFKSEDCDGGRNHRVGEIQVFNKANVVIPSSAPKCAIGCR